MRTKNDITYKEYKDHIAGAFNLWKEDPERWTPEMVTDYLVREEEYADYPLIGASKFLWFLALGEYEITKNILEERVLLHLSYHIYRYEQMGKYKAALLNEEIEQVESSIAYIKSKVRLPELMSYEDMK